MGRYIDMTGMKVGELSVLEMAGTTRDGKPKWKCRCGACGNEIIFERKSILRRLGKYKDCGCVKRNYSKAGDRKEPVKKNGHTLCWTCSLAGKSICQWDREFKPVPGWVAEETRVLISFKNQYVESYRVISCPMYRKSG